MTNPTSSDIPAQYDAGATERALYAAWEAAGLFHADPAQTTRAGGTRDPFTIVIPPPNVTAVLHVGHGLNNAVQDVIIRWRRMAGDEALWVPGTDHAGIATQNVVEKLVATEGKTRFDLGREAFVARTAEFVRETGGTILQQLRAIGASADWTRTAYTLSPDLSRAVRECFVRLYEKGLVYRGHRVIHWCPRCLTSLSDEEAEFKETHGKLYHVRYPFADDPTQSITVATTRPETMLGDVAVAVHPDDARYQGLIGTLLTLPIAGVSIPIIADSFVDQAFGTGMVKITPAHDPNDYEAGKRNGLAMPVVITPDGRMDEVMDAAGRVPEALRGLDRFDARKKIVKLLEEAGLLDKVDQHHHSVRHCYRCHTVVEPRLSDQWFVQMAPLAKPALQAVRDGTVRIVPERWEAVYVNWMEGIRDWNISRQLWWGHRIPVWRCACGHEGAFREDPAPTCPACGAAWTQDEDVLDTWFSSWLWPISTLGWPGANGGGDRGTDSADLKAFYPTDVLVTAPEILFFWVARMIMAGYEFTGKAPFHTVYLHGTVRDMQHRKMSKSLGNGIDPLEVVDKFGADALRWTMIAGMGMGVDVLLDPEDLEKSFAPGRNFATKLWNIGRFLLMQVGDEPVTPLAALDRTTFRSADHWIVNRLADAVADCDAALGPARPPVGGWPEHQRQVGLRLDAHAESARRFLWNDLADWYVEACKTRLAEPGADRDVARALLVHCFDQGLRLLHPIMPFITETLWQKLPGHVEGTWLVQAKWPVAPARSDAASAFEVVKDVITAVRQIRNDYVLPPTQPLTAHLAGNAAATAVALAERAFVHRMSRADLVASDVAPAGAAAHALLAGGLEVVIPLEGIVDVAKERGKLETELTQLDKQLTALLARLANTGFTVKAPAAVVDAERAKAGEWGARAGQLRTKIRAIGGA
ncbi:MAG: valine--tRNA ligase [Gemmatimonadetes bacterium]|nr:valine--tRNA ligase [Gemmatimonadota bacterium]